MQHDRADHIRPFKSGAGEFSPSEDGTIHLDPAQIEPREIQPGQIGRCEIRASALAPFGLQVQSVRRQPLLDLSRRKRANGGPDRKIDHSGKGRSRPIRVRHRAILLRSAERR